MNREIKFRAKRIESNEWVYGGYYKHLKRTLCPIADSIKEDDYQCLIITSGFSDWNMPKPIECVLVDELTVGQFTGMRDKNNKEIYEGDIVKFSNPFGELIGTIRYYSNCKPIIESDNKRSVDIAECNKEDLEVLGNKFDN